MVNRALFLGELQRALWLQVGLLALGLLGLVVAIYAGAPIIPAALILLVYFLALGGLFTGMFAFHEDFQKKRQPLLLTLPIKRTSVFYIVTLARAAASILSITAIIVIVRILSGSLWLAIPAVVAYWVFFSLSILGGLSVRPSLPWEFAQREI